MGKAKATVSTADWWARIGVIVSLVIGLASLGQGWFLDRKEDRDLIYAGCSESFTTGEDDYPQWPKNYPVTDSLQSALYPFLLIKCDLTNAGRRPVTVTNLLIARGPTNRFDSTSYAVSDTLLALPLSLGTGEARRINLLLGSSADSISWGNLIIRTTARGASIDLGQGGARETENETEYKCWRMHLRFVTALGARAEYVVSWHPSFNGVDLSTQYAPCWLE